MKRSLSILVICLFFLTSTTRGQWEMPSECYFSGDDISGNTHVLEAYLADDKPVFVFIFDADPQSWLYYESLNLNDLYNTYGQGGTGEVVVLCVAGNDFPDVASLSGIDYSAFLGPSYNNLSYLENNDVPIILNAEAADSLNCYEGALFLGYCPEDVLIYNIQGDTAEEYLLDMFAHCCLSMEEFDPSISSQNSWYSCEPQELNFRVENGTPTSFSSLPIQVFINDVMVNTFIFNQTVEGCGYVDSVYVNTSVTEGDEVRLVVGLPNQILHNDTAIFSIESFVEIPGHVRLEVQNPGDAYAVYLGSTGNAPFPSTMADATTNWQTDLYLPEGCHHLTVSSEFDGSAPNMTVLLYTVYNDGTLGDTLLLTTLTENYIYHEFTVLVTEYVTPMISGHVFEDINGTQVFDPSLPGIPGIEVNHFTSTTFTDADGYFQLPLDLSSHVEISYDQDVWSVITTPNPLQLQDYSHQHYFGLSQEEPVWELTANFGAWNSFQCFGGIDQSFYIGNTGNQPVTGHLVFTFDPILTPSLFNPQPTSITGNEILYDLGTIGYNGFQSFWVAYSNDTTGLIGELLNFDFELITMDLNGNVIDTSYATYSDTVFCAYDPNDIYGFPLGEGPEGFIPAETKLDYRIRFQNTGNLAATTVVVIDTIPSELDLTTFTPGFTSHVATIQINQVSREVAWTFNNIMLPDSASDPIGSIGHIWYGIEMADLIPGEQILNRAFIYFDQNPAIETNTSLHTISTPVTTRDFDGVNSFRIYPVPAREEITLLKADQNQTLMEIRDIQGRLVQSQIINSSSTAINIAELKAGVYIVSITDVEAGKRFSQKLMKLE